MATVKRMIVIMIIAIIRKTTANNNQNSNKKKTYLKKTLRIRYISESLGPQNIPVL